MSVSYTNKDADMTILDKIESVFSGSALKKSLLSLSMIFLSVLQVIMWEFKN
jgi:hypothetical protein